MEQNNIQQEPWPVLKQLPKNELTSLVEGYVNYTSKIKYIYYFIGGFMVLLVGYNLFFGGKSYPYAEAKSIENTFAGIIVVFLVVFIVVAGLVISKLIKLKKAVKQSAVKHRLDKETVLKEFDTFVKTTIGGTGLR